MRPYDSISLKEIILTLPGNQADGKTATVVNLKVSKRSGRVAATILWKGIPPLTRKCADTREYALSMLLDKLHPDITTKYEFVKNHLDPNAAYEGCMFDTFGKDVDYVWEFVQKEARESPERTCGSKVWTIVDGDEGQPLVVNGYHYVNRQGYLISTVPAASEDEFYYEEDTDEF